MKEKTKFKATILTMISSIFNTIVVSVLGLVYNNLIIRYYGSSINGLTSTLTQFVSLFTVIEGGFSVAAVVSSYDSVVKKNYKKLNDILYTTNKYLKKISIIFSIVVLLIGLIYLQFIDSPLSLIETISMLIITILTTAISMGILSSYTIVMSAHNSGYITSFISMISKILTWMISFILILNKINIVIVYVLNVLNILVNVLFLKIYLKKHYPYVTYKGEYNRKLVAGTNDVLFQKLASTIFTSTDLVLISAGISLAMASVYNLYNQIFQVVFHFLTSVVESPFNSFGQLFSNNEMEKISNNFDIFQKIVQILSTILLSVVGMSILSFIKIYTKSINDINYIIPIVAILFYSQFYIQFNNKPYAVLLNASGNFKMQNVQSGIAAVLNIVFSVILMKFIGVSGVILGSIIGTLIIMIMNIYQFCKYVINDKIRYHLLLQFINYLSGVLLIVIALIVNTSYDNYIIWAIASIINVIISSTIIVLINYIFDNKRTSKSFKFIYNKIKRQNIFNKGEKQI